jgi:polyketide biosynthesis acyl carrier protein
VAVIANRASDEEPTVDHTREKAAMTTTRAWSAELDAQEQTVLAALRSCVQQVRPDVDTTRVTPAVTLSELGCDSMDRAEIVVLTQEALGLVVPVHEFAEVSDVATLVRLLRRHS